MPLFRGLGRPWVYTRGLFIYPICVAGFFMDNLFNHVGVAVLVNITKLMSEVAVLVGITK